MLTFISSFSQLRLITHSVGIQNVLSLLFAIPNRLFQMAELQFETFRQRLALNLAVAPGNFDCLLESLSQSAVFLIIAYKE